MNNLKYKNSSLPVEERVNDLLSRMTLEEKIAQMQCLPGDFSFDEKDFGKKDTHIFTPEEVIHGIGQIATASVFKRPKENVLHYNRIQTMFMTQSRLGIPVIFHEEALHGHSAVEATSFLSPLAMAGTWDPDLIHQITTSIAEEVRVRGGHLVLTPVLDLARDPRWGRTEETFGEDPYLVTRMGVASITGFQGKPGDKIDSKHVAATMKHFTAHGSPESGINISPPRADEHTLYNLFLIPFKAAVQEAKVNSVMPSYNEINGIPAHANHWLLIELLRKNWGYKGIVVSDYFALRELATIHFVAKDETEAASLGISAGVDIDLPTRGAYKNLLNLVKAGKVKESLIDQSVKNLLRLKFKLGLFENYLADTKTAVRIVGNRERRKLARKTGQEAVILLKNENNLLPLDIHRYKKIALIGPLADQCVIGNYSKEPKQRITPLQGILKKIGSSAKLLYSEGVKLTKDSADPLHQEVQLEDDKKNLKRIKEAIKIAKQSNLIILCLGANAHMMREGWAPNRRGDNATLELRCLQNELVKKLVPLGKPIVVIFFSGGPLCFEYINQVAPAILECWYLGQETGDIVADVLFGDVNPSGKLPITIPRSVGHLPVFYNRKPSSRIKGYLFDDTTPLYPFGYGLSYTSFEYQKLSLSSEQIRRDESLKVKINVSNTGKRSGKEIVQLYIRDKVCSCTRPVKELKDFKKIFLKAGETKTVEFLVTPDKLGFYNMKNEFVVEPGDIEIMVGRSSEDYLIKTFTVIKS